MSRLGDPAGSLTPTWALCAVLALAACGSDTDEPPDESTDAGPDAAWCERISTDELTELVGHPVSAEEPVPLGDTITCNTESDAVHLGWQARPAEVTVQEFAETYNTGPRELQTTRLNGTDAVLATVAGEDPTTAAAIYLQVGDQLLVVTATAARPVGAAEPPVAAETPDQLVRLVAERLTTERLAADPDAS